jgi:PhnB protein
MRVSPYLNFQGQCEEAFQFYERCFSGQLGALFRYEGSPMAGQAPEGHGDWIMHGSVTIGDLELMGADVAPQGYQAPAGFQLSLQITGAEEAERIFAELSPGGRIIMPLEKTFWAERFGMVVDRFGIPWLINCEAEEAAA